MSEQIYSTMDVCRWLIRQGYKVTSNKPVVVGRFEDRPIDVYSKDEDTFEELFLGTLFMSGEQKVFKVSEKNTKAIDEEARKVAEKISSELRINVSIE